MALFTSKEAAGFRFLLGGSSGAGLCSLCGLHRSVMGQTCQHHPADGALKLQLSVASTAKYVYCSPLCHHEASLQYLVEQLRKKDNNFNTITSHLFNSNYEYGKQCSLCSLMFIPNHQHFILS